MSIPEFALTKAYQKYFMDSIPTVPRGKYVSILLVRETMSYAIFTTEGEILDTEKVNFKGDEKAEDRLILFKRKQVAPERRTGKALMRNYEIVKDDACYLMDKMCGKCPDCIIYGYAAVEGTGARKSRLLTDSCFSIRPYSQIQKMIKSNAISDQNMVSKDIREFDHVKPQVFLPAVETCLDLTVGEFIYVMGNILRTTRYGKESTREGYIRNHLMGIAFSETELFSNLEFSQGFYESFGKDKKDMSFEKFSSNFDAVFNKLKTGIFSPVEIVSGKKLTEFFNELAAFWQNTDKVKAFLKDLNDASLKAANTKKEQKKKGGKKGEIIETEEDNEE